MPECVWVLRVREFGPLIVTVDTQGNNLYTESKALYASRLAGLYARLTLEKSRTKGTEE
jgi:L(+)-tartrate dehydratase beta subunit